MTKRKVLISVVFVVIMITALFLIPYKVSFVFFEQRTTNPVAFLPLTKEKTFHIRYTHSIHLSDVLETYEVTDNYEIQLSALQYEDFAIGMPSDAGIGEKFEVKDGKYFISNMTKVYPSFDILIGDIDKDLVLQYVEREHNLKVYLTKGDSYTFQVSRLSILDQLRGVRLSE